MNWGKGTATIVSESDNDLMASNSFSSFSTRADFFVPNNFPTLDKASVPTTTSQLMVNRSHSLEPHDFELESDQADIEMDVGFQAALELLQETNYAANLPDDIQESTVGLDLADNFDSRMTGTELKALIISGQILAPKSTTKRRPRVSMKQQINTLHDTVQELTTQLQLLESKALRAKAVQGDSYQRKRSRNASTTQLWQQVAERQLERRQEAEKDNTELRMMLEQQVLEAKNLKRILKRRTRIEMMEDMLGVKRQKMLENDKPDDLNDLRELLRCSDELYTNVDQQFKEKGMEFVPCPGQIRHVNSHAINDVFMEVMVQQLVPFGEKVTEDAVWAALGQVGMQQLQCVKDINAQVDFFAQNTQETADTMMISYTAITSGLQGSDLQTTHIRKVMRKYVEADRVVFISRMEVQPQYVPGRVGIKQWCDIQVVVEKTCSLDNESNMTTVIKSRYSISRHIPHNRDSRAYTNVKMAIAVWDEAISRVTGDIETILLEADSLLREQNLIKSGGSIMLH